MCLAGRTAEPLVAVVVVIMCVCALVVPKRAVAQDDPSAQRDHVRAQRAALAGQLDMLQADDSEVLDALKVLEDNVRAEQARVDDAERERDSATQEAAAAREAAATKAAELRGIRARLAVMAVDSYMNPPGESFLDGYRAQSAQQAAERHAFVESRMSSSADLLDEIRKAAHDLDAAVAHADEVAEQAEQRRREAEERLVGLGRARSDQQALADQAHQRLESKLAEAAALASYDRQLSDELAASQMDLSAELARIGSQTPVASTPSVAAGATTTTTSPAPTSGSTSITPPTTSAPTTTTTRPADPPVAIPPPAMVPLVTVGGITVNASISAQLDAMLKAARVDGVNLSGSGYRDSSAQIALRRANCGTSDYAIYEMPASSCSPPTARPGTSNHERGLAIDFRYNGGSMSTRSNPGYIWLAANASKYGFYNLPSEPWHWSIDGH